MKYCEKCNKQFDTAEDKCPVCGEKLVEVITDEDAAMITATTTLLM